MRQKIGENKREAIGLLIIGVFFLGYYLYRMFAITPWYDEVYTYINFISKGPVYAAIHWPLPNNHVFFSVISSLFTFLGVYVGLRGISFLAAMGTLALLYFFLRRAFSVNMAFLGTMVYGMLYGVNLLSLQGRGYSLATFFLILSLYCGLMIAEGSGKKRHYVLFSISLWLGLYTLMSSIYWVLPVCVCCGLVLLLMKRYRELFKLIVASVVAAGLTMISYTVLWMSIGAQLVSADVMSGYFQAKTSFLMVKFPRTCFLRGFRFMAEDSNLQSLDRSVFLHDFKYFARNAIGSLFNSTKDWVLYSFYGAVLVAFICLISNLVWKKIRREKPDTPGRLLPALLSTIGFVLLFFILLIQSVYPFTRVFSFLGIFMACLFCFLVWQVLQILKKSSLYEKMCKYAWVFLAAVFLISVWQLMTPVYNKEYELGDYYAKDAIDHVDWERYQTYFACDVLTNQQLLYHYVLGEKLPLSEDTMTPEIIFLRKGENTGSWIDRYAAETIAGLHTEERTLIYENDHYLVYE